MRTITVIAFLTLVSCGPLVTNADKSPGLGRLQGAGGVSGDFGVQTATQPHAGTEISGVSCKNLMWDADPTTESAISMLKSQAHAAGFNTVFITSVGPDSGALLKNCWTAVVAKGVAFNS